MFLILQACRQGELLVWLTICILFFNTFPADRKYRKGVVPWYWRPAARSLPISGIKDRRAGVWLSTACHCVAFEGQWKSGQVSRQKRRERVVRRWQDRTKKHKSSSVRVYREAKRGPRLVHEVPHAPDCSCSVRSTDGKSRKAKRGGDKADSH